MSSSHTHVDQLEDRARQFRKILLDVAADENGVMRTCIHFDEMRPLTDADMPHEGRYADGSASAFHAYEDAGMTTGAFLAGESLRYQVAGDPEARQAARAAFRGLRWIYDLGMERCEGYFCKPYHRRISDHISRDQYLYAMSGMHAYYSIADADERRWISRMLLHMARYWVSIDYTSSYFGMPASSHLADFMGSLFLGVIRLGYTHSEAADLSREFERLIDKVGLDVRMSETLRGLFLSGRKYDNGTYFRGQENPIAMKTMAIDHLWDADPARRDTWAAALRRFWHDDLLVAWDRASGLNYFVVGFSPEQNRTFFTKPGVIPELSNPLNISMLTWGGRRRQAGSTLTAYAATVIADRLHMPESAGVAREILEKLDLPKFRGLTVSDPTHVPPGQAWELHALHTCHLAYWLWAYWLGRKRGVWRRFTSDHSACVPSQHRSTPMTV